MDDKKEVGQGRVTISRVSSNMRDDYISIHIDDHISGLVIWRGMMEMVDFARAITGYGGMKVVHEFTPTSYTVERYGKERVIRHIAIVGFDRNFNRNRFRDDVSKESEEIEKLARKQYKDFFNDGWEIFDNGIGRRQEDVNGWDVILVKFVDKEG